MTAASDGPVGNRLPGPDGVNDPEAAVPGRDEETVEAEAEVATAGGEAAADVDAADVDAADVDVSEDLDELIVAHAERDSYLDALRRLQADFENYKKRMAKQRADQAERAAESLVEKLLPVLDTADLAHSHGAGEDLTQVRTALIDTLAREGLDRIDPDGGPFDPNVHDAVAHEPGDGVQEVAEVMRVGYWWKGRVLRPAMVKVRG
ncbi:MAG: nucleotide exchange factor GrpE [Actinomycetota bacterium]|nr:nucleotide exchange factor GrpE [Actinomycetota bacterium]